uniref:Uncharacterized protein n=1 Tax=Fomitiporia mediterranea TaxID=208960 RepID=A0A5B9R9J6_9AGAM|nr:hypothetical protein Fomme_000108 [Fomitiporia mediterranea]QEG57118.1 hypothetical protein Fomme_000108 [Fomitiporia mediterranea]
MFYMIIIIRYLLSFLGYFLIFIFACKTIIYVISSYLGIKIIVNVILIHAIWLSLIFYSLIVLVLSLGKILDSLDSLFYKEYRDFFIYDIKNQIKKENKWLKNKMYTKLFMQFIIFTRNVVKILFKRR